MNNTIQNIADQAYAALSDLHQMHPGSRRLMIAHEYLERALEHINAVIGATVTVQSGGIDKD